MLAARINEVFGHDRHFTSKARYLGRRLGRPHAKLAAARRGLEKGTAL